jgi:hypothetical protein
MLELLDVAIGFATVMLAVSLIIMSLTQAISSLLALRGAKLRRGLEELITQTVPSLRGQAAELSKKIVQHPLISDGATSLNGRWRWASTIKREELLGVLDAVLKEGGNAKGVAGLLEEERQTLLAWFDSFMARVSQWFVMNTRWITVGLAIIVAFVMHLDSLAVLRQLKTDTETRAKVVAMSSSLLEETPESIRQVETFYQDTLKEIVKANPAQFASTDADDVSAISSRPQAAEWIRKKAKTPAGVDALVKQFNDGLDAKLSKSIEKSVDRAKTLQAGLSSAGIDISFRGDYDLEGYWNPIDAQHVFGVMVSVFFLSLGAPFWFNLLKNMTSLKSVVAQKDAAEDEKQPAGKSPAGPSPVTMFGINSLEKPDFMGDAARLAPAIGSLPALPPRPAVVAAKTGGPQASTTKK